MYFFILRRREAHQGAFEPDSAEVLPPHTILIRQATFLVYISIVIEQHIYRQRSSRHLSLYGTSSPLRRRAFHARRIDSAPNAAPWRHCQIGWKS